MYYRSQQLVKPNFSLMISVLIALMITLIYTSVVQAGVGKNMKPSTVRQHLSSPARKTWSPLLQNLYRQTANSGSIQADEASLVSLINQERAKAGLNELKLDPVLVRLAAAKSQDMVHYNYFGHNSQRLGTVYEQLQHNGYASEIVAENLVGAAGYSQAHQRIMASPGHRSNLLNPAFKKIGVGIVRGGPCGFMITQIFSD